MKKIIMDKIQIRPKINSINSENMSSGEMFQNITLRPVIKLQHEILFKRVSKALEKTDYSNLSFEHKTLHIKNILFKNINLRNEIIGLISGCFTNEEYDFFIENYTEINKRIINIIIERIISNLK